MLGGYLAGGELAPGVSSQGCLQLVEYHAAQPGDARRDAVSHLQQLKGDLNNLFAYHFQWNYIIGNEFFCQQFQTPVDVTDVAKEDVKEGRYEVGYRDASASKIAS